MQSFRPAMCSSLMITLTALYRKSSNKPQGLFRKHLLGIGAYSRGAYSREGAYSAIAKNMLKMLRKVSRLKKQMDRFGCIVFEVVFMS